jgi:Ca2+-binding RTX toxin-like protein
LSDALILHRGYAASHDVIPGRENARTPAKEEEAKMRRISLLLVTMAVMLILGSGVALAGYFVGTRGSDNLRGTNNADEMYGLRGGDNIRGHGGGDYIEGGTGPDDLFGNNGSDEIYGGKGVDDMFGGDGNDYLNAHDDAPDDRVDCGPGTDIWIADVGDILIDCP